MSSETSTPEKANGTRPHSPIKITNGRNNNLYNTLYQSQHVDKQMKDLIIGKLQFGIRRIRNQATVPLNKGMNLVHFEHSSARVPIQPRVQQNSHEQNM